MRPPILILGSHRSGTTLLVRLLQALGLFAGRRLEENLEAWFFLRRNEWLLRRAGGAWDRPRPVRALLGDPEFFADVVEAFAADVRSRAFGAFAGRGDRAALEGAWGFKDPRSVFTLDVWSAVFPGARVVHVTRHGVDVAGSLVERATRGREAGLHALTVWPLASRLKAALSRYEFLNHYGQSARCLSLAPAFELWEESVEEGARALDRFRQAGGEALDVRFEDLVAAPAERLAEVAAFCGLDAAPARIAGVVGDVRPERAFAFRRDPRLRAFLDEVRERPAMRRLAYDREGGADA